MQSCSQVNPLRVGAGREGGILLEETDGLLTAGIGLNVNWSPEVSSLREGAALPPGRLVPRGGAAMDPYELWRRILRHLREADPARLIASWRALAQAHLLWLGSDVAVESAEGALTAGRFIGLAPDGELLLETPSGEIVTLDRGSLIKAAPAPHAAEAAPRN